MGINESGEQLQRVIDVVQSYLEVETDSYCKQEYSNEFWQLEVRETGFA